MSNTLPEAGTLALDSHNTRLEWFIETAWFRYFIIGLIILNAIILGVLTYDAHLAPALVTSLNILDQSITIVFAAEILVKLFVYRHNFFRSGWNWFDLIVVSISFVPGGDSLTVLRAMRVLRVLRLLHIIPMMKRITEALFGALPGMGAIIAVLMLVTYVGAVMATNMFGDTQTPEVLELFGDLPKSAYSLFQVMTMDGWRFEVVQKVIDDGHPYAWVFFLLYIFIANFAILNLFIALVVDALQLTQTERQEEVIETVDEEALKAEKERAELMDTLKLMRGEIQALERSISTNKP